MKSPNAHLLVLLATTFFFSACNSPETNSTAEKSQEEQPEENLAHIDTTLADPTDSGEFAAEEDRMNNFLAEFELLQTNPTLIYEFSYEYEGGSWWFFYEEGDLKGVYHDLGIEGGEGGELRIKFDREANRKSEQTVLYIPYQTDYEKGYFSYFEGQTEYHYEITRDKELYRPHVSGISEPREFDFEEELNTYLKIIQEKRDLFTLQEKFYRYDILRETVDSEYGEVEISETISADSSLFRQFAY